VTISDKQSEKILDLIYDAAVEEDLWRSVLAGIADLTRSQGGILFGQSFSASRVYFDFNGRLDPECNQAYQDRHMQNPWSESMEHQSVGRIVLSDDVVDLAELQRTAFFDEVLRPQDVSHNAMIALAARDDFRAAFNICRTSGQGPFGQDERKILSWLVPHLKRSIALGFRLEGYQLMQRAAFNVLEYFSDGVILLDRRNRVTFANVAAREFGRQGILRFGHSVAAQASPHAERLAALIRSAMDGHAGGSMSMPGVTGQYLSIIVYPLRATDVGRFSDEAIKDSAVVVFVIDPVTRGAVPLDHVVEAFGLTRAEARVALAASSGRTVVETASALGLSANTIKTHLRRVFEKTGTTRQAELARLMASLAAVAMPKQER
jgi:DNA-binding CsgD family transcriptional regulator/PAS domain-containing protein